jgi:hypothetical protein
MGRFRRWRGPSRLATFGVGVPGNVDRHAGRAGRRDLAHREGDGLAGRGDRIAAGGVSAELAVDIEVRPRGHRETARAAGRVPAGVARIRRAVRAAATGRQAGGARIAAVAGVQVGWSQAPVVSQEPRQFELGSTPQAPLQQLPPRQRREEQNVSQPPQLLASVDSSVQAPLPAERQHAGVVPFLQTVPQPPQSFTSLASSTHPDEQQAGSTPLQVVPQPPQFFRSLDSSTHPASQQPERRRCRPCRRSRSCSGRPSRGRCRRSCSSPAP